MEKIFSIASLKSNTLTFENPIVIPDWIFNQIISICKKEGEYAGYLVCRNQIVEYPFLSGNGTVGSVYPKKKLTFNNSLDYETIEFHTHTSALGDYWTNKFSGGDLKTFNNRCQQDGDQYKHILFTTDNILTWGKFDAPDIRIGFGNTKTIIENFNHWNDKYRHWRELPKTITNF